MSELKHVIKDIEFKQNYIGDGFLRAPENNMNRVNIFGEITKLENFSADKLYLFYEFDLPLGWKIDDENEYYEIYKQENVIEEDINKLKSVTHKVKGRIDDSGDTSYSLAFPFELELLAYDRIINETWPKILIQINSIDSWNRQRIEGYTFINIPNKSGFYQIKVPCYAPIEDLSMNIFSYFLGGSRRIPDLKDIAKTCSYNENQIPVALNKYGIKSKFTGFCCVNINVSIQSFEVSEFHKKQIKEVQGKIAYSISSVINEKKNQELKEKYEEEISNNKIIEGINTQNFGLIGRFTNS